MTDDVKAAWERARDRHWRFCHDEPCLECADYETVDLYIDGEQARQDAAVAAAREEQAQSDLTSMMHSHATGESWSPSLTATPLADRIAELEAELQTAVRLFEQEQGLAVEAQERALEAEGNARVSRVGVNLSMHVAMCERAEKAEAERDAANARAEQLFLAERGARLEVNALVTERDALRAQVEAARKMASRNTYYGDDVSPADIIAAMDGAKPK